ncbi:MAG TPA: mandelate racemase/muconate lactonizing enzyme family protein [Armatimonadota bacterium]|nr:mandelate racemase/muconate lactonizing enzyme family protein [Armatimonadota bacterium]
MPLAAVPRAGAAGWCEMNIVAVEPVHLHVPLDQPIPPSVARPLTEALDVHLVRVSCDDGSAAWGEAWSREWPALTEAVELLATVPAGADPLDRGLLWERMVDRLRLRAEPLPGGAAALSALDQALWDLAARSLGLPVYQLLGGRRLARLDTYATGLYLEAPDVLAAKARQFLDRGFRSIKMKVGADPEQDIAAVRAVKDAVGPQTRLMVDANQAWTDRDTALRMCIELSRYELFWIEEPMPPTDWSDYVALRNAIDTPIAGGETLRNPGQFRAAFEVGALDVAMPDVRLCGGITGLLHIASLARWFGVQVSPHNWASPLGAVASSQAAVTLANCNLTEVEATETPLSRELIDPPLTFEDGFLILPEGPGFGVTINEDFVARHRADD